MTGGCKRHDGRGGGAPRSGSRAEEVHTSTRSQSALRSCDIALASVHCFPLSCFGTLLLSCGPQASLEIASGIICDGEAMKARRLMSVHETCIGLSCLNSLPLTSDIIAHQVAS